MKVLFVCWGNINRSQIAEAIFNKLSKDNHAVSAGIKTRNEGILLKEEHNNPVIPMKQAGFDLSAAKIKLLSRELVDSAGKVVVVLNKEKFEKELPEYMRKGKDLEFWDIDSISDETPFEEYCSLENARIKRIELLVEDLVKRVG